MNSLSARLEKVWWWIERAAPDVLLLQETKLTDEAAPVEAFAERGYTLAHHGQGGRNGVAIASRVGLEAVSVAFDAPLPDEVDPDDPNTEARIMAATCGGVRVVSVYVPNGRTLDSLHYHRKLEWLRRFSDWVADTESPGGALVLGGDFNIAPNDADVWDPQACHGGTHVSGAEREALARFTDWGLVDGYRLKHPEAGRYSWWDYRAGAFHKNWGMRIDLMLVTTSVAERVVGAEIDREARKGKPIPSDHAPVVIDLDEPGLAFDARWERADAKNRPSSGPKPRKSRSGSKSKTPSAG